MSQFVVPGATAPSDPELISAVRGGNGHAYGVLFERHRGAAVSLARQIAGPSDADDLVSDAFIKVLRVLTDGGGPDVAFRAYLLTAVRRLHIDRIRANSKVTPSDEIEKFDPGVPFVDPAVSAFESTAAAKAFASLPERWQLVLWHLEVEGQKPAEVAPLLGVSANSVSALAYRAREGLRQAYLQMHLADTAAEECRWVTERLGAHVRKGLSRRDAAKVDQHLDECTRCAAVYLELTEVNSNLAAIIAPLLLGSAAAAYVAGKAGATSAVGAVSLMAKLGSLAGANSAVTTGVAAAVSVAVVATAVVVLAANGPDETNDTTSADAEITQPVATSDPADPEASEPSASDPGASEPGDGNPPTDRPPIDKSPGPDVVLPPPFVPAIPSTSEPSPPSASVPSDLAPSTSVAPDSPSSSEPPGASPSAPSSSSAPPTNTAPTTSPQPPTTSTPPTTTPPPPSTPPPSTTPSSSTPPPSTPPPPLIPAELTLGELTFDLADLGGTNAGDLLTATVSLENVGESTLIDISAGLDIGRGLAKVGAPKCPSELVGGETAECTVEYTLSQTDVDLGELTTTVTVSGEDKISGETVTASQQATYALVPAPVAELDLDVTVTVAELNGQTGVNVDDRIDVSFRVENTGAVTLSNATVEGTVQETKFAQVACGPPELVPGGSAECETSYHVTLPDVKAGTVTIEAVALGKSPGAVVIASPDFSEEVGTGIDASVGLKASPVVGNRFALSITTLTQEPATTLRLTATSTKKVLNVSLLDLGNWTCDVGATLESLDCTFNDRLPPAPIALMGTILPNTTITVDLETVGNEDPDDSNNHAQIVFQGLPLSDSDEGDE